MTTVTAKIIDLGLAKTVQERGSQPAISALGAFAGTPEFASPEQFAGVAVDIRSDLYSFGVTLWEMLTGQVPFSGTPPEVLYQHQHASLPVKHLIGIPQVRAVPKWLKKQAYARYGIAERKPGDYKLTPADGIRMNWESFPLVESRPASVRPMSVEFLSKLVNRLIPTIRQARQWCITGAKLVYQYQSGVAPGTLMLS